MKSMYQVCVGTWGIQPSEFENHMGPHEFYWLFDAKRPDKRNWELLADKELRKAAGFE